MTWVVSATYDGSVLRPDGPLPIPPNTRIRITIDVDDLDGSDSADDAPGSFLDTALALDVDGPPDWVSRLDDYLYGHRRHDSDNPA